MDRRGSRIAGYQPDDREVVPPWRPALIERRYN
jgi:hypothetical protein